MCEPPAHLEVLPPAQRAIWSLLAPTPSLGMVLHGGTAVALHYGHRVSVDYDFVGPRPLDKQVLRQRLGSILDAATVLQDEPNTLTVLAHDVKISFFGVGLVPLSPPSMTIDGTLLIASPLDLLAEKLKVILERAEAKDYLDIVTLLRHGSSLAAGLEGARRRFGHGFQPAEALKALTYFDDIEQSEWLDAGVRRDLRAAARSVPPTSLSPQ